MFCKHKWNKLSEVILPSAFEQLEKSASGDIDVGKWAFQKKVITIVTCENCGAIKEFVNSLYGY